MTVPYPQPDFGPRWVPGGFPINPGTSPYPQPIPPLPVLPSTDAVKCPDCGTWWRGYEHRCPSPSGWTSTTNTFIINDSGEVIPQINGGPSLTDQMDAARKKAKGGKSKKRLDKHPPDMIR